MTRYRLDVRALYAALDACRTHDDLSWRGLGRQTGLSASTFSRMMSGGTPDADALITLLMWLRVPLDRFIVAEDAEDAARIAREYAPRSPETAGPPPAGGAGRPGPAETATDRQETR